MASSCNRKTNPSAQSPQPAAPSKTEINPNLPAGEATSLPRFSFLRVPYVLSGEGFRRLTHYRWSAQLAFRARGGNNPVGTDMRLACGLKIALWLSFTITGMACVQQEPNSAGQTPAPPDSAEQAPAKSAPAAESKAPQDRGSGGRSERTRGADCARHTSRRSHPAAAERGTVARRNRQTTHAASWTRAGRATAGDGGANPQLYGGCAHRSQGRRCAAGKHAGGERTPAGARFDEALEKCVYKLYPLHSWRDPVHCAARFVMLLCIT